MCVPIDAHDLDNFNPFTVPTISQLVEELNALQSNKSTETVKDYKKTSLKDSIKVFEKVLHGLENSRKGKRLESSDATMEF